MLELYVISHKTEDGDIVYFNEQNNIFVDTIENASWYTSKVDALLVCRRCLRSYLHITIKKVGE